MRRHEARIRRRPNTRNDGLDGRIRKWRSLARIRRRPTNWNCGLNSRTRQKACRRRSGRCRWQRLCRCALTSWRNARNQGLGRRACLCQAALGLCCRRSRRACEDWLLKAMVDPSFDFRRVLAIEGLRVHERAIELVWNQIQLRPGEACALFLRVTSFLASCLVEEGRV